MILATVRMRVCSAYPSTILVDLVLNSAVSRSDLLLRRAEHDRQMCADDRGYEEYASKDARPKEKCVKAVYAKRLIVTHWEANHALWYELKNHRQSPTPTITTGARVREFTARCAGQHPLRPLPATGDPISGPPGCHDPVFSSKWRFKRKKEESPQV